MILKDRKFIIIAGAIGAFIVIEIFAILIGLWIRPHTGITQNKTFSLDRKIRIGIIPLPSKAKSREEWEKVLNKLEVNSRLDLSPFYASFYEDILTGFMYNTLDIAYLDPAMFQIIKNQMNFTVLAICTYNKTKKRDNRVVLASKKNIALVQDAMGLRLSYVNKNSFDGFVLPEKYLNEVLPEPANEWFERVFFSNTVIQGIEDMMQNKTDIISSNLYFLKNYISENGLTGEKVRLLWISKNILPGYLLCINNNNFSEAEITFIKEQFLNLSNRGGNPDGLNLKFKRGTVKEYDVSLKKALSSVREKVGI